MIRSAGSRDRKLTRRGGPRHRGRRPCVRRQASGNVLAGRARGRAEPSRATATHRPRRRRRRRVRRRGPARPKPRPLGGPLDRATKLAGSSARAEPGSGRPGPRAPRKAQAAEEVRAQREQNHRSTIRIPDSLYQGVEKARRSPSATDGANNSSNWSTRSRAARSARPARAGESSSANFAGTKEQRLPTRAPGASPPAAGTTCRSRKARRARAGRVCESRDELVDEPLPPAEELRVLGLERRQALVRAGVSAVSPSSCAAVVLRSQRVLEEDRPLELLQLDIRLEPELVARSVRVCL